MKYLKQIQLGIDYIEAHLNENISVENVASAASISRWHFQRIFKALTNETLKTYIRSRRMANSLPKLLNKDNRIIDISIEAGFESQQSYTRAFKRLFNLTPNQFRQIGDKTMFMQKIKFDQCYLQHINRNISLNPEILTHKPMTLVGLKTDFYGTDSDKNNLADKLPDLWQSFLSRIDEIDNRITKNCYGVIHPIKRHGEQLQYYATTQVSSLNSIPNGMNDIELPERKYACFTHKGPVANINNTVNYIYSSWLLNSNQTHSYQPDIETYGHEYHPTSEQSVIYYSIPIV